ncbi:MAG: 3-mercaptopyruvate sulfurtransferase, partial [Micavibrio aeruginosavorus]
MNKRLSDNGMISAQDLYYMLGGKEKIKILDATYSLPTAGVSPLDAFLTRHIANAQFFDIDAVADQDAPLPHTMPSAEYFESCVESLGISSDDHVVVYDQSGAYMASSRAWWMFRVFGHENVYVLEGGMHAWTSGGFKTQSGPADAPALGNFKAALRSDLIVSKNDLLINIDNGGMQVLDARAPARFEGRSPEPWAGKRSGHIP